MMEYYEAVKKNEKNSRFLFLVVSGCTVRWKPTEYRLRFIAMLPLTRKAIK